MGFNRFMNMMYAREGYGDVRTASQCVQFVQNKGAQILTDYMLDASPDAYRTADDRLYFLSSTIGSNRGDCTQMVKIAQSLFPAPKASAVAKK